MMMFPKSLMALTIAAVPIAVNCAAAAMAQSAVQAPAPPAFKTVDPVGIDLMSQSVSGSIEDVSIGSGPAELKHVFHIATGQIVPYLLADNFVGSISGYGPFTLANGQTVTALGAQPDSCPFQVSTGDASDCFTLSNGVYSPTKSDGATLVYSGGGSYVYTSRSGIIYTIQPPPAIPQIEGQMNSYLAGVVTSIKYPTGNVVSVNWTTIGTSPNQYEVIASVTNSFGMMLSYQYKPVSGNIVGGATAATYYVLSSVTAINNAIDYCAPASLSCSTVHKWKSSSYSYTPACSRNAGSPANTQCLQAFITDQAGEVTRYTMDTSYRVTGIKPPTSTVDEYTIIYCMDLLHSGYVCANQGGTAIPYPNISSVPVNTTLEPYTTGGGGAVYTIKEGRQWAYFFNQQSSGGSSGGSPSLSAYMNNVIDPDGRSELQSTWVVLGAQAGLVPGAVSPPMLTQVTTLSSTANTGNAAETFTFRQDLTGLLRSYTGHGYTENYTYDARSNLLTATKAATSGSGVANIVRSAAYPSICTNMVTCNKPTSVTDANGNATTFTYDPNHGGVLTETMPAGPNGVQPQKRYTYALMSAYYLNASGATVASPNPIWMLTQESECRSGAASGAGCATAGDEIRTTYLYGAAGTVNNLLLRGTIIDSSPGGQALTTCYSYDANGNKISQTLPRAGLTSCP